MRVGLIGVLVLSLAGCVTAPATTSAVVRAQPSVCLVTSAAPTDWAINQSARTGLVAANAASHVIESTTAGEYAANLERCAAAAADLTVAPTAAMAGAVWQVARAHPSRRFALVDAEPITDQGEVADLSNVTSLLFKEQEAGYLVGVLAGMMEISKVGAAAHNRIAGLGTKNAPASQRYLAGFVAGAQSVDPKVGLRLDWTDRMDQASCKAIGNAQVTSQADVLFQAAGACGAGYIEAAYDGRAYAIGSDSDQATLSPAVITSALKRVDRVLQLTIQRLSAGTFTAGPTTFGLADGATGFAQPSSIVPQTILIQLATVQATILAGTVTPPTDVPPAG